MHDNFAKCDSLGARALPRTDGQTAREQQDGSHVLTHTRDDLIVRVFFLLFGLSKLQRAGRDFQRRRVLYIDYDEFYEDCSDMDACVDYWYVAR